MNKRYMTNLWRRRDFLNAGARTAAAVTLMKGSPTRLQALDRWSSSARMTGADEIEDKAGSQFMEDLVLRAIDSARSAGAQYSEARVTRTVVQELDTDFISDSERLTIGVRVLIDGAWGFASSTFWELDEAAALAKEAIAQARINSSVFPRDIELGTYPVARGNWTTPIRIDPFQIPIEEKLDFFRSLTGGLPRYVSMRRYGLGINTATLLRQERTTANSEGSLFSQTLYQTGGAVSLGVEAEEPGRGKSKAGAPVQGIGAAGAGWELFEDAKIRDQFPALAERAEEMLYLPVKPVDVGRYDAVMTAASVSRLIAVTLGDATQLDRALGMEANAGGTSYLGPDPHEHLGSTLGSSLLTIAGNRSLPRGLATVKWDDEGVEPETFPIIQDGTLVDYQTTREQAAWLASWYRARQQPMRSHGCSVAPEALNFPLQHTPNLAMSPGKEDLTFDDLVSNVEKGIAYFGGRISTDFQSRNGGSRKSLVREIVDGKLGAILAGADILFASSELWKHVVMVGGPSSVQVTGTGSWKGQPSQSSSYSIESVPVCFKEMTVVDGARR